jgi:hypothetical protein
MCDMTQPRSTTDEQIDDLECGDTRYTAFRAVGIYFAVKPYEASGNLKLPTSQDKRVN